PIATFFFTSSTPSPSRHKPASRVSRSAKRSPSRRISQSTFPTTRDRAARTPPIHNRIAIFFEQSGKTPPVVGLIISSAGASANRFEEVTKGGSNETSSMVVVHSHCCRVRVGAGVRADTVRHRNVDHPSFSGKGSEQR